MSRINHLDADQGFDTLKNAFEKSESSNKGEEKMEQTTAGNNGIKLILTSVIAGIGGYILWRNRTKVQQFIGSMGIPTSWKESHAVEAIQAGAAKVVGVIEHEIKGLTHAKPLSNIAKDLSKETSKDLHKVAGV